MAVVELADLTVAAPFAAGVVADLAAWSVVELDLESI